MSIMRNLCVFCGSSMGLRPSYKKAAEELGRFLATSNISLIYGGAKAGLMGALADAALQAGGEVIGVIPGHLVAREIGHAGLTKTHVVGSMHERKAMMSDLSDAFLALPGGFGTFEEFCEVLTWSQLGLHQKPCGLLNVDDYYFALIADVRPCGGGAIPQSRESRNGLVAQGNSATHRIDAEVSGPPSKSRNGLIGAPDRPFLIAPPVLYVNESQPWAETVARSRVDDCDSEFMNS